MALKYVVKTDQSNALVSNRKSVKKSALKKQKAQKPNIEKIVILRQTPDVRFRPDIETRPTFLTDPSTIESIKEMISKRRTTLTPIYDKFNFKSDFAKEQLLRSIIINDKRYVTTYVKNGGSVNFEVLNFVLEDPQLQVLLQPPTRPRPLHLTVLLGRKRITAIFLQHEYVSGNPNFEILPKFDSNSTFTEKLKIAGENDLINTRDAKLQTPLMLACVTAHIDIIKYGVVFISKN